MGKGRKFYTQQEKVEALKTLEVNDFNYYRTAKILGIPDRTLKRWYDKFGKEVLEPNRFKGIVKKVEGKLELHREKWLKEVHDAKMEAIKAIRNLIPREQNLDNLNKSLRLLHEIDEGAMPKEEQSSGNQTFFQTIHQALITNHGTKGITTGGDTEEHTG